MADKEELKHLINDRVNELIDGAEKIGNINFFEIDIKNSNGDITIKLQNTYKEKIK